LERWSKEYLKDPWCAVRFINFLHCPPAEEILIDSLVWINTVLNQEDKKIVQGDDVQEKLISLLDICWRNHKVELIQNQTSFEAFKSLLNNLVDHQNSIALALQDQILKNL
jgi:hypothetical protein